MYQYKNNSEYDLVIPGIGMVAKGGTIESETEINNPNLEMVEANAPSVAAPPTPVPVTQAKPETDQEAK